MNDRIFKSTKGHGCPVCENYPGLGHAGPCMFEDPQRGQILSGIDPRTGEIFNWFLAKKAAEKDVSVRQAMKDQLAAMTIRPKLSALVVPSYNRLAQIVNEPIFIKQKPARRDQALYK